MAKRKSKAPKLPPVKRVSVRKGNHPSNPYQMPAEQIETPPPSSDGRIEPSWTMHASDPLAGPIVRFWANASRARLTSHEYEAAHILARRMDDWRGGRR